MALIGIYKALSNTERVLQRLHGDGFREALLPAARRFLNKAFILAPYDQRRKKGIHLRDALFIDTRKHRPDQTNVLVGVNQRKAPHAHLQEFGWVNNPVGHPFLRPAAAQVSGACAEDVARAVKEVVERY